MHHALTGELYADALQRCGVNNFAVRANDYCLHADDVDLKFGGNAQSISGKRWLHARHGQGRRPGNGRAGQPAARGALALAHGGPLGPVAQPLEDCVLDHTGKHI